MDKNKVAEALDRYRITIEPLDSEKEPVVVEATSLICACRANKIDYAFKCGAADIGLLTSLGMTILNELKDKAKLKETEEIT